MAFKSETFYAVVCDFPGCGATDDGGEYTYWSDKDTAVDAAVDGDWSREEAGERIFCQAHHEQIHWLSDEDPGPMTANDPDLRILTLPDGERVVLD